MPARFTSPQISLFTPTGGRKYLNASEERRFARASERAVAEVRLFCLTLALSGARISEILAVTPAAIDLDCGVVTIRTLKRRKPDCMRQVPLPRNHITALNRFYGIRARQRDPLEAHGRLWRWSRTTAWRRIKEVMTKANIVHSAAMPKGLRHGFGIQATTNLVPLHLVQRWLGHASLKTTAIYCDVSGPEERLFVSRMWRSRRR